MAEQVTYSREADWSDVLGPAVGISHRSTTSSRLPGKAIEGSVHYQVAEIVTCPRCGSPRRASLHPHAPRWLAGELVDCRGEALQ